MEPVDVDLALAAAGGSVRDPHALGHGLCVVSAEVQALAILDAQVAVTGLALLALSDAGNVARAPA
ncbi:hypothetical protein [Streptomyces sp. NPDC001975]